MKKIPAGQRFRSSSSPWERISKDSRMTHIWIVSRNQPAVNNGLEHKPEETRRSGCGSAGGVCRKNFGFSVETVNLNVPYSSQFLQCTRNLLKPVPYFLCLIFCWYAYPPRQKDSLLNPVRPEEQHHIRMNP